MKNIQDHCVICKEPSLVEVYPASSNYKSSDTALDSDEYRCTSMAHYKKPQIAKCLHCGVFQIPKSLQPANLIEAYADVVDQDYLDNFQIKKKTFSYAYKNVSKFITKNARLLEIGSYCGLFLAEAVRGGSNCTGIEPSRWAAAYAQTHLKSVNIINQSMEEAILTLQKPFDVIVSWDVIEHIADPMDMIYGVGNLLDEGGYFIFSTINIDSSIARLMGARWHWIMDMHLYYFTKPSLENMLQKGGFKLVETGGHRHYASLRYAYKKFCNCFPEFISKYLISMEYIIPDITLPFNLGDVNYYVAKRVTTSQ